MHAPVASRGQLLPQPGATVATRASRAVSGRVGVAWVGRSSIGHPVGHVAYRCAIAVGKATARPRVNHSLAVADAKLHASEHQIPVDGAPIKSAQANQLADHAGTHGVGGQLGPSIDLSLQGQLAILFRCHSCILGDVCPIHLQDAIAAAAVERAGVAARFDVDSKVGHSLRVLL
jgi:hypothetical protein